MNSSLIHTICTNINIELLDIGCVKNEKGWYEGTYKPNYDIWIGTSGETRLHVSNREYILKRGDIFFHHPRQIYEATCKTDSAEFIYIHFTALLNNHLNPLPMLGLNRLYEKSRIQETSERLIEDFDNYKNNDPMALLAIRADIMQLIRHAFDPAKASDSYEENEKYYDFEKILKYINDNIANNPTVKELANQMLFSEKYFISYFKSVIGISPHQYIVKQKMQLAYHYLNDGKYSISEISKMLGYSDIYSFSKAYKKSFGYPPSKQ